MKLFIGVLLDVFVAPAVVGVMTFFKTLQYRGEARQLAVDLLRRRRIWGAREKITKLNNDVHILLANRVPGVVELQPGDTRTYSAWIQLQRDTPSKYLVVDVN